MAMAASGAIARSIRTKLSAFNPVFLDVINESHKHNVPKGSESHFKVIVVSEEFEGLSLIKRHRAVNHTLAEELAQGVHALQIVAKTPSQVIIC
jgi:stress-induced morphogen